VAPKLEQPVLVLEPQQVLGRVLVLELELELEPQPVQGREPQPVQEQARPLV
jgi:hypothetical protein